MEQTKRESNLQLAIDLRKQMNDLRNEREHIKTESLDRLVWREIKNLKDRLNDLEIKVFFNFDNKLESRVYNAMWRRYRVDDERTIVQRLYEAPLEEISRLRNLGKKCLEWIETFKKEYKIYLESAIAGTINDRLEEYESCECGNYAFHLRHNKDSLTWDYECTQCQSIHTIKFEGNEEEKIFLYLDIKEIMDSVKEFYWEFSDKKIGDIRSFFEVIETDLCHILYSLSGKFKKGESNGEGNETG